MHPPLDGIWLFAYGELLEGGTLEGLVAGCRRWPARVPGFLYRLPSGAPGLALDQGEPRVWGELIELPDASRFRVLDLVRAAPGGPLEHARVAVHGRGWVREANAYVLTERARRSATRLEVTSWRRLDPHQPR